MTNPSPSEYNDNHDDLEIDREDITANFTIVPNALIRDKSISPDCCHLIIYLISHMREWRINTKQLVKEFKGRYAKDKLYSLMNEAIEAGYMKRDIIKNGSRFNGYRYTVSSSRKFKKCLPHPGFPETEAPQAEKSDTKEDYPERRLSLKENNPLPPKGVVAGSSEKERQPIAECLRRLDIPEQDKINLTKKFSEKDLIFAVTYCSQVEIKTTLIKALWWAAEKKPEIPQNPEETVVTNKAFACEILENSAIPPSVYVEILSKCVEINYKTGQCIPFVLEYSESGFKSKLKLAINNYKIIEKVK